jgi:dihydrolipoamide dehydrogenase
MGEFIRMPKLGMTMTEGHITRWLVQEGQTIEKGDLLFEVETDKTALEVDSLYAGLIRKIYYQDMTIVPVNAPVAFIGTPEEEIPAFELPPAEPEQAPSTSTSLQHNATHRSSEHAIKQTADANIRTKETDQVSDAHFDYDLIVIGAGPGGYVSAIRAAQLGAKVAIIEKDACGGTCLNRGCIPTKAYYEKAKEWAMIQGAKQAGFTIGHASFDWRKIVSLKDDVVGKLVKGVGHLLEKNGVTLIHGAAMLKAQNQIAVGAQTLSARYIVLATGGRPVMRIPTDQPLCSTDDVLSLETLPKRIVIIGGGVVGCEMANIFRTFGVDVTIIELMPRILPMMDEELSAELAKRLKADGVKIRTDTSVERVAVTAEGYSVVIASGAPLACDLVLEAIGRQNDPTAYEQIGVKRTERGFISVDANYQTSIENVFAIGDCNGISQLAHSASHQGIQVAEQLFGESQEMQTQPTPVCIFSALEIASVGKTLAEASKQGLSAREIKIPYLSNGKALAMNAKEGFVKVVVDEEYGEILGVHIIGEQASTLIHEAVMAMRGELTAFEAGHTIHAHPSLSELLMEAFLGGSSGAIHV